MCVAGSFVGYVCVASAQDDFVLPAFGICLRRVVAYSVPWYVFWVSHWCTEYCFPSIFFPSFFFRVPFIIFALLVQLSPSRNSDPGSHSRLFSPPLPTTVHTCLAFLSREGLSTVFPRRLASNCAYLRCHRRSRQLVSFF